MLNICGEKVIEKVWPTEAAWLTTETLMNMSACVRNYDPAVDFSNTFHFESFFFSKSISKVKNRFLSETIKVCLCVILKHDPS